MVTRLTSHSLRTLLISFVCTHAVILLACQALAQNALSRDWEGLVETRRVTPGAWYHQIQRPAGPWAIHVLEFDYDNPHLRLETARAEKTKGGLEQTSLMARRYDRAGHRVVAAVNGDFFTKAGSPVNLHISAGELISGSIDRSIFAKSTAGSFFIGRVTSEASVMTNDGLVHKIHGVNRGRQKDEIVLYNHHHGRSTGANRHGVELRLFWLERFWTNDTVAAVIVRRFIQDGNSSLDDSTIVLSAHGIAAQWTALHLAVGDTVHVIWRFAEFPRRILEAIGGTPRLIRNGTITIEGREEKVRDDFVTMRHPRTAIGYNEEEQRCYLVAVDGRQPGHSAGMTLRELAALMQELGCTEALNLDGGGSTTLVLRGQVVNRPSDLTGERPVANALQLISTAPAAPLSQSGLEPREALLFIGESLQFEISPSDTFLNAVHVNHEADWRTNLGSINSEGLFAAGMKQDSGFVHVDLGDLQDSALVFVRKPTAVLLEPSSTTLKPGEVLKFDATIRAMNGKETRRPLTAFVWEVEGAGAISPAGEFTATDSGRTIVIARFKSAGSGISGRAIVEIRNKDD